MRFRAHSASSFLAMFIMFIKSDAGMEQKQVTDEDDDAVAALGCGFATVFLLTALLLVVEAIIKAIGG